ncbi:hypothetical protein A4X13_0g9433 [Tilletia indica]|uniref:Uncharacterized protein n=1 Tax=Tilletia indica TaxID=43049 RepID=A0A8T8S9N5_9BASI|nr:hypothetical protein A4X13_0g9433 [Tilletia indica]
MGRLERGPLEGVQVVGQGSGVGRARGGPGYYIHRRRTTQNRFWPSYSTSSSQSETSATSLSPSAITVDKTTTAFPRTSRHIDLRQGLFIVIVAANLIISASDYLERVS